MLINEFPTQVNLCVSHTTRRPREGEIDGVHYHFTTKEQMLKDIENNKFIETTYYNGNYYGTSFESIREASKNGKICILEIDLKGCESIDKSEFDAKYIFIAPPSHEELENRLRQRNSETEENLLQRLEVAKEEIEAAYKGNLFDHIIVNDNLEETYKTLVEILVNYFKIEKK